MRVYLVKQYYLALALLALMACSGNPDVNTTPQAKVAHYASTVIQSVTVVQKSVTEAARSEPSFVPTARDITTVIEKIHAAATKLADALEAYDAATTLDARKITEAQVQASISAINSLLVEAFNIKIPANLAGQISSLIANVAKTVSGLAAELARFRAATVATPVAVPQN